MTRAGLAPERPPGGVPEERRGALRRDLAGRRLSRVLGWVVPLVALAFLWLPIAVLVGFSFNDAASVSIWRGFSLRWYENVFSSLSGGDSRFQTDLLLRSVMNVPSGRSI